MIQYISYMNIFCDKKFKSLFISLLNKENIINGRQTENRMRACVRACVCVRVCVLHTSFISFIVDNLFFFFLHKIRFLRQQFIFKYTNGKIQLNKNNDKKSCNYIYFHLTIEILMLQSFFPIRTSLCPSERFLNVKKLWTTKIGNNDDLIECLSYNRFSRW